MEYLLKNVKWCDIKPIVDALYIDNQYLTPYSSYDFLDKIKKRPNIQLLFANIKCKFQCYALMKNEETVAIAPLHINDKRKEIYLLGHFSSVGHIDLIYSTCFSEKDFKNFMILLGKEYPGYVLMVERLSQYSPVYKYLTNYHHEFSPSTCVQIDIEQGYDAWFLSLSKSCRQNIRTSYNRLAREECALKYISVYNTKPEQALIKDNLRLFSKRILEHSEMKKWLFYPMLFLKKRDGMSKALFEAKENIFASIYINEQIAASCNGVIANDGRAIITRLSIETSLGKYSPGGILINELIKECSEKHPESKSIDLSRGTEKYKYVYGGQEHFNYSCSIEL